MRNFKAGLLVATILALASPAAADDLGKWKAQAARISIVRDDWGIAHVHGKTDADAVFGMVYAQAEDDFNRVETNYITNLGRTAEAEGEAAIWQDLRQKLFIDPADLKTKYAQSPPWLQSLMTAWADSLNYYLATHPKVKPRLIAHFEPWMALSFTEGSIGGDIEQISLKGLEAFYGKTRVAALDSVDAYRFREPSGSNGMAIGPSVTRDGHALLLINPHTSFFFRSELQMTSDEGLNAYGAATWGQIFVYQGFNEHAGWMHTTSGADTVDEFAETIIAKDPVVFERRHRGPHVDAGLKVIRDKQLFYRYGGKERPVTVSTIAIPYRGADGSMQSRSFTVYRTHHGPIVREENGKWIAISLMQKPIEALEQSFGRTKTTDYASFLKVASLAANSSNNTLFADSKGEVALLLPQFMPRRDDRFDYTKPVDGSDPATDWKGIHPIAESPHVLTPANGWIFNVNDAPWSAAGADSPKKGGYPRYMDSAGVNARTPHAIRVLSARKDFTLPTLMAAAYDPYMPTFAHLIPGLLAAYDAAPEAQKAALAEPISELRSWDYRWSAQSVATSLAVFWGEALWDRSKGAAQDDESTVYAAMAKAPPAQLLAAFTEANDRLTKDFGTWRTPWGEINRFQRNDAAVVQTFDDTKPSVPVPFASAQWGSLASFGARRYEGTRRYYGTSGNSFVAVVEFGDKVRARAVTAGGGSGDVASKHFGDQAQRYADGALREVYFYPDQLKGHTERTYRPGE